MSIKSKEDLLNKQAEVNEQIKSYTCRVLVCSGTGCVATGSQKIYEKFMENSKECKKNIHDFVTFYLQTHKIEEISKPKKEFKVPDSIEDFNILDFV